MMDELINQRTMKVVASCWLLVVCTLLTCNAPPSPVLPTSTTPIPAPHSTPPLVSLTSAPVSSPEPSPTAVPTALGAPQSPTLPARPQLSLRANLDYSAHRMRVQEVITYPNRTGVALSNLALDVLAARRSGVFELNNVNVYSDPAATSTLEGSVLQVAFNQPLAADAVVVLSIEYTLDLPPIPPDADGATGTLGWSARQINLGDWFPTVSAYRDGWLAERNPPHVVGETTAPEAADISVDLGLSNVPRELQVIASAPAQEIQSVAPHPSPLPTEEREHALRQETSHRYRFSLPGARSFALSLGTDFEIAETTTASGILVRSAYFREHAAAGRAALQTTADALEVYAARYGPYRYQQLSAVEADFLDGMEYSGFYFLGNEYYAAYDGTPRNYLTAIAAHEVAHQWWYDAVGNDQAREPWLDEALCTYSELIYYQALYPDLVDWWWDFRVRRFKPAGWVNASVYDFDAFRPYVNAVYLRGAMFMEDLRSRIGDEAFFAFLQDYAAQGASKQITAADFFATLYNHTPLDLDSLTPAYFSLLR